jgi:hypothetical protein
MTITQIAQMTKQTESEVLLAIMRTRQSERIKKRIISTYDVPERLAYQIRMMLCMGWSHSHAEEICTKQERLKHESTK